MPEPVGVPHHYLFIDGMDHYLGGLICRTDVPGPPDDGALRAIRHASTLFLNAYAQGDRAALGLLRDGGPGAAASDRAALSVR